MMIVMNQSELLSKAERYFPGACLGMMTLPDDLRMVMVRGQGSKLYDAAGREYLDCMLGSGPLILGHARPEVVRAVQEQVALGSTYFALNQPAILLAEDYANWQAPRGYVEDLGEAIALCVVKEEAAGRVYHAGDAPSVTETAWIERMTQTTGWPGKVILHPNNELPESLQHNYDTAQSWALDSARIRRELGYGEVTPPSVAMQRTIEWERANPPQQIDPAAFDYAAEDAVLGAVAGDR